jgi:hypothetical protein
MPNYRPPSAGRILVYILAGYVAVSLVIAGVIYLVTP